MEEDAKDVLSWETLHYKRIVIAESENYFERFHLIKMTFSEWMNTLKKEHKIKGKNLIYGA